MILLAGQSPAAQSWVAASEGYCPLQGLLASQQLGARNGAELLRVVV